MIHVFSLTACKSNPKLRFAGHTNNEPRAQKDPCAQMPQARLMERGSIWTGTAERVRTCVTACIGWPLYSLVAKCKADTEGYFFPKILHGIHLGERNPQWIEHREHAAHPQAHVTWLLRWITSSVPLTVSVALHRQVRAQPAMFRCQAELYCLFHRFVILF